MSDLDLLPVMPRAEATRRVDRIRVIGRHRVDLGDLTDLAASIAAEGLLHPIVVTNDDRLIAGHRRLEACKSLGWTDVPVRFIESVTDASQLLRMERDENTCRKDMTPSEKVSLGCALEELERPKAKAAQTEGQERGRAVRAGGLVSVPPNENQSRRKHYDVREDVAPAVGMSTATYSRAKQLVTAANNGDPVAAEQVKEMDRTGKVTKPYETWKGHKVNRGPNTETKRDPFGLATDAPAPKKKSNVKNYKGRKPIAAMEGAVATLSGITMPMNALTATDFADLPDEVRTRWTNELSQVLSILRHVRDLIKEQT